LVRYYFDYHIPDLLSFFMQEPNVGYNGILFPAPLLCLQAYGRD